jgi:hypothetical protein
LRLHVETLEAGNATTDTRIAAAALLEQPFS